MVCPWRCGGGRCPLPFPFLFQNFANLANLAKILQPRGFLAGEVLGKLRQMPIKPRPNLAIILETRVQPIEIESAPAERYMKSPGKMVRAVASKP